MGRITHGGRRECRKRFDENDDVMDRGFSTLGIQLGDGSMDESSEPDAGRRRWTIETTKTPNTQPAAAWPV